MLLTIISELPLLLSAGDDMAEFFSRLLGTESWPPRWHCGDWTDFHGWLYILSDLAIAGAYFTIPFLLIHFILRKKNVPFPRIFWLFGTFIMACGTTHLIDAIIFWEPVYRLSALVRFFTALASWGTIVALYKVIPHAFSLKTPAELERVVNERTSELHLSVQKMKFLADAMPLIVWTARPDGSRDYFNETTIRFTGKTRDQLVEWKWVDLIHPDDREEYLKKWDESLNNGSDFVMEKRLRAADGSYLWHLSRAHAHRDEEANILMWVGTATDIELQKQAAVLLEKKVTERTEELRQVNEQLLQSNADLEQFAAIASHDLQAPLRTISNYLEIVSERNAEKLDEESRRYIGRVMDATLRMKRLIGDLLEYTRINASKLNLGSVDMNRMMQDVTANLHDLVTSRNAEIRIAELPVISADGLQMSQLFQNLIANAVKYNTSKHPLVTIQYQSEPDSHLFTVSDNGVGIEEKYLEKIFEVFARLETDKEGTGLGLTICKRIVDKHHGTIAVSSTPGQGTQFVIRLPRVVKEG